MKTMMRSLWLLILCFPLQLKSQEIANFTYLKDQAGDELYLGVSADYVYLTNPKMPDTTSWNTSGFVLDVNLRKYSFRRGGVNYQWDYKLLFDLIFLTKQMVDVKSRGQRTLGSTVSGGITGWHQWTWNIMGGKKWNTGFGIALNDYFVGTSYYDKKQNKLVTPEPQGWYLATGPAFSGSYLISNSFLLHGKFSYVMSYSRPISITYADVQSGYPKPHFAGLNLTLLTKWGLFAEAQFCKLINRGNIPNAANRSDVKLGFNFVL